LAQEDGGLIPAEARNAHFRNNFQSTNIYNTILNRALNQLYLISTNTIFGGL